MARREVTRVDREQLLDVCRKLGMAEVERTRETKFYKADSEGNPSGRRSVGIPNTKQVSRIELVGFEHELGTEHPKPPAGTVTQMVDFAKSEKEILQDLKRICKEGIVQHKEEEGQRASPGRQPRKEREEGAGLHA